MPNWCSNRVHISGSAEDVVAFKTLVNGDKGEDAFSFQAILPCPEELHQHTAPQFDTEIGKQLIEKYGASDWYQWQVNNWGTKWDTSDSYLDYADEESASWYFSTAWSPPEGIYNELSRRFPDLNISWFFDEPGMQIAGYLNNPIHGG